MEKNDKYFSYLIIVSNRQEETIKITPKHRKRIYYRVTDIIGARRPEVVRYYVYTKLYYYIVRTINTISAIHFVLRNVVFVFEAAKMCPL